MRRFGIELVPGQCRDLMIDGFEMGYRGSLDIVRQSHLAGWAGDESGPVPVTLVINGEERHRIEPNLTRPDLAMFGYPAVSGFIYNFAEPLGLEDTVSVHYPDGMHVMGSPSVEHTIRLKEVLDGVDLSGRGLELGPLDKALLSKKRTNVLYVDHASKADLQSKYGGTSEEIIVVDQIPETDIVWPGGRLADVCPAGAQYDFCVSSHAIEHVPDMIGWIVGITEVLRVGGLINLAIPHRDRCFDRHRRSTTTSEFIADHIERRIRPSARQIFDSMAYFCNVFEERPVSFGPALEAAKQAELSGSYLDVHCQVFTLTSFLEVFADLATMGLIQVRLRAAFPCRPGSNEFVVSLQKTEDAPAAIAASYRISIPEQY